MIFNYGNQQCYIIATTVLFLCTAVFFTIKTGFIQFSGIRRFLYLIRHGVPITHRDPGKKASIDTMSPTNALLTAMGTTIGMGNMVGPGIAIMAGGPGALFWLIAYIFFSSAIKYVEVVFALKTRRINSDGLIVGGPMCYLKKAHPFLAHWYIAVILLLFAVWSSIQSNTLATIFALEGVAPWIVGFVLSLVVFLVVRGGAKRVGEVASRFVPFMFSLYLLCAMLILVKNPFALISSMKVVFTAAFKPQAPIAGFVGVTFLQAIRAGTYRGIHITESGLGSASIPHAVATVKYPIDQGLLALFSGAIDALFCMVSGMLILVTGVWMTGNLRSTLIYEVFSLHAPAGGSIALLATIVLFVLTTIIGNSFNGMQVVSSIACQRVVQLYLYMSVAIIFCGAFVKTDFAWMFMDSIMTLAAIPNLVGLVVLSIKYPDWLRR